MLPVADERFYPKIIGLSFIVLSWLLKFFSTNTFTHSTKPEKDMLSQILFYENIIYFRFKIKFYG